MINKTIQQELEELRQEIENLKEQKVQKKESIEDYKSDIQDNMNELLETIKKDYADMSPVTAIGIFALGVIFGRFSSNR